MQNRVDEAQMRVPGYRDRVVHVSTSKVEGGMNLDMPPAVITALTARGRAAASLLVDRFARPQARPGDLSWDSHRWTRYRSAVAALGAFLRDFRSVYAGPPSVSGERTCGQLSDRRATEAPAAYRWRGKAQHDAAISFTAALDAAVAVLDPDADVLREGAPRPPPESRIVPRT
jgi:hypothetical protein